MSDLNLQELQDVSKAIVLSTIEAIIKHNNKAAEMIRSGNYNKEDIADFSKKLMNLIYIIYPSMAYAREFITKEHPEFLYILDFVEKTYNECEDTSIDTSVRHSCVGEVK